MSTVTPMINNKIRTIAAQTFLENFHLVVLEVRNEVSLRNFCSKVNAYLPLMLSLLSKTLSAYLDYSSFWIPPLSIFLTE